MTYGILIKNIDSIQSNKIVLKALLLMAWKYAIKLYINFTSEHTYNLIWYIIKNIKNSVLWKTYSNINFSKFIE